MIYAIAGHSKTHPGAIAHDGTTEHQHTTDFQQLFVKKNQRLNICTDDESFSLSQVITWINKNLGPNDYVLDFHFNNNNPDATGTEVFIHENAPAHVRELASEIVTMISQVTGLRIRRYQGDRIYKYPKESAIGTLGIIEKILIEHSTAPVILIEFCFLNQRDMAQYLPQRGRIAERLHQLLIPRQNLIGNLNPKSEPRI